GRAGGAADLGRVHEGLHRHPPRQGRPAGVRGAGKHRLPGGRQAERRGAVVGRARIDHGSVHRRHAAGSKFIPPAVVATKTTKDAKYTKQMNVLFRVFRGSCSLSFRVFRGSRYCVAGVALIVTREILPTPLSASQRFPCLSISMLRTVPPPPGIGQVRNFFVSGLKRTSTFFASSPVSTYQTAPSAVTSIAYGLDSGPP